MRSRQSYWLDATRIFALLADTLCRESGDVTGRYAHPLSRLIVCTGWGMECTQAIRA